MSKWQDISISDAGLKAEFITRFFNGDYLNAFRIIEDNPQLDTKAFVANVMNEIANLLSLLQNNFQNNVIGFLSTQLSNFYYLIDEFELKNEWDESITYEIYNFVVYNNIDYLYINPTPSAGIIPTNTDYWLEINIRGQVGAPDLGVNLKYNWDFTVEYYPLDIVYYNNALWVAKVQNVNITPSNGATWEVFLPFKLIKIYSNENEPTGDDLYKGAIWFDMEQQPTYDTITGNNLVYFTPQQAHSLSYDISFNPMQRFNGYDKPWAGGDGKNKFNNASAISSVYFPQYPDGRFILVSRLPPETQLVVRIGEVQLKAGNTYLINANSNTSFIQVYLIYDNNTYSSIAHTDSNPIVVEDDENVYVYALITQYANVGNYIQPTIRLSSELNAEYTPYENICPIIKQEEINMSVSGGINLFDKNNVLIINNAYIRPNNNIISSSSNSKVIYIPCRSSQTYSLQLIRMLQTEYLYVGWTESLPMIGTTIYDVSGTNDSGEIETLKDVSITVGSTAKYLCLSFNNDESIFLDTLDTLMIQYGDISSNYEDHVGDAVKISINSEQGYGGSISMNRNGVGTLRLRPYYASYNNETLVGPWVSSMDSYVAGTTPTIGAEVVDMGGIETTYNIYADSISSVSDYMNTVWASPCDSLSVTYQTN